MTIKKIEKTLYVAWDGQTFTSEDSCLKYEKETEEKRKFAEIWDNLKKIRLPIYTCDFIDAPEEEPLAVVLTKPEDYEAVKKWVYNSFHYNAYFEKNPSEDKYPLIAFMSFFSDEDDSECNVTLSSIKDYKENIRWALDKTYALLEDI